MRQDALAEQKAEAVRLYAGGMSCAEVSRVLDIAPSTVGRAARMAGVIRDRVQSQANRRGKPTRKDLHVRKPIDKRAAHCSMCGQLLDECPGEGKLCGDCVADAEKGVTYAGSEHKIGERPVDDLSALERLIRPYLPPQSEIRPKGVMMLNDWTATAVCHYCRVVVQVGPMQNAVLIDGAEACAWCKHGLCHTKPGAAREASFVAFVLARIRAEKAHAQRDAGGRETAARDVDGAIRAARGAGRGHDDFGRSGGRGGGTCREAASVGRIIRVGRSISCVGARL